MSDEPPKKSDSSLQRLLDLEQAVKWVLEDGQYKAPEEWNWLCKRWYEALSTAWGVGP